jgi:hypothetical protein
MVIYDRVFPPKAVQQEKIESWTTLCAHII